MVNLDLLKRKDFLILRDHTRPYSTVTEPNKSPSNWTYYRKVESSVNVDCEWR